MMKGITEKEIIEKREKFLNDPIIKSYQNMLLEIYSKTIPSYLEKPNGEMKIVYDKETQKIIDKIKHDMNEHINAKYSEDKNG